MGAGYIYMPFMVTLGKLSNVINKIMHRCNILHVGSKAQNFARCSLVST